MDSSFFPKVYIYVSKKSVLPNSRMEVGSYWQPLGSRLFLEVDGWGVVQFVPAEGGLQPAGNWTVGSSQQ